MENQNFEFNRKAIKGYPELNWTGKMPHYSTQYYPAQLKERYGDEKDNWINKIFWGDNLQVMSHLLKNYRGKIDMIYIDPPFDSKADYKKKVEIKGVGKTTNDSSSFEEKQYGDIWNNDEYLQFIYERLLLMRELLSDKGSLFFHCDWHKSHHLRCILDEVFGPDKFMDEIIWHYMTYQGKAKNYFPRKHDNIFWYYKKETPKFNLQYSDDWKGTVDAERWKNYLVNGNEIRGANYPKTDSRFSGYYNRFVKENGREPGPDDIIMKVNGYVIDDVWMDVQAVDPKDLSEKVGYPTQKPESLLTRIIESVTEKGDLIFDCFMGSGTTQAVAMKLDRRFIGADINLGSVQTTTKRLLNIMKSSQNCVGFEVYNVNNYDFFRNPIEAKTLLMEALEIQPYTQSNIWDGELDGNMVKIMPVNRIATKADLKPLLSVLPYKVYEKRKEEDPNSPVEKILIVCMGHEPDLKGYLEMELSKYKVDIRIVDILRDKKDLQFKRDSEIEIHKEGNKLIIDNFYPMNLMQKLSLSKDYYVDSWKQLVESIMIDWNYDGVVLQPSVIDVPEKKEFVKGCYEIPETAGIIKIKITDLLSESLEIEV